MSSCRATNANALGIASTNAVNDHLRALERKGCLARAKKLGRSLALLGTYASDVRVAGGPETRIPVYGSAPIGAFDDVSNIDSWIGFGDPKRPGGVTCGVRVRGSAMALAGFCHGDIALIDRRNVALTNGTVVTVILGGVVLVRTVRVSKRSDVVQFTAPGSAPFAVRREDIKRSLVIGRVVGCLRVVRAAWEREEGKEEVA